MVTARSPSPSPAPWGIAGCNADGAGMAPLSSWMAAVQVREANILTAPVLDLLAGLRREIVPLHKRQPQGQMSLPRQGPDSRCVTVLRQDSAPVVQGAVPTAPSGLTVRRSPGLRRVGGSGWIHEQPARYWDHSHPHPHPSPHSCLHPRPHSHGPSGTAGWCPAAPTLRHAGEVPLHPHERARAADPPPHPQIPSPGPGG